MPQRNNYFKNTPALWPLGMPDRLTHIDRPSRKARQFNCLRCLCPYANVGSFGIALLVVCLGVATTSDAIAQMGGGSAGGGPGAGGGGAPPPDEKPKFLEHIHSRDALPIHRENGDAIVLGVDIIGNRAVGRHRIEQQLETRKDRFYDYESVLGDVRRLNDMGSFDQVTFRLEEKPGGVKVTFIVHERPIVTRVVFHGNRALNNRELSGRGGVSKGDPLSEFAIESARRRLLDYYHEEGFNQASISASIGLAEGVTQVTFLSSIGFSSPKPAPADPGAVVFRINEGPKERIADITIEGNTIVNEARLKKIIKSRGPAVGILSNVGNTADLRKIDEDVNVLAAYYHNLGFLTATVGRRISYDESGKWMTVAFVVNEGPRFSINEIQIVGNEYISEESIRQRLSVKSGDMFDGTLMRSDVGEIVYGYGELGFIYAEVQPKTVMRDEVNVVDLVYEISEGDRWKVGEIFVNIEGEPHLMKESTMLNLIDLREGDIIDRRTLETNRRRIERSQLLETNPSIADPPDIKVVPRDADLP